ncbi:MAG: hypothetical protein CL763_00200 [Chloroflexi bacterium]|nr:hypothetical protein [Chloroflexota bacterium]|tara:strand:- start:2357 stop:2617 length:261 start_codon:yes stop_codon:yes gene_type:complete
MKKIARTKKIILLLASVLLLFTMLSLPASASAIGQSDDNNSNLGYLLAGSLLTWAGFFIYAFFISKKNASLHREIAELQKNLNSSK